MIAAVVAVVLAVAMDWPASYRAACIAAVCLILWLTESVPMWVPTVVLWIATTLLLGAFGPEFRIDRVVLWSANPVLILFLGGFALAVAARRQGADVILASATARVSRGQPLRLLALTAFATAGLSMWMSNIAAAALMLGALNSFLAREPAESRSRRAILLAVAMGANVGGIATPIGSGPNGIAIASVALQNPIGFVDWMIFGVPLTVGLVCFCIVVIGLRMRPLGAIEIEAANASLRPGRVRPLGLVLGATVLLWLSEPLHGVPAWIIASGMVFTLFAARLLRGSDILHLEWPTILLIAGGIGLGALLERSGLAGDLARQLPLGDAPPAARLIGLCFASAIVASLMSNTATAALLIPLAATFDPAPSTAIIVAVSTSLGAPFLISSPPNAMAVARGLPARDLLIPGLMLLVVGSLVVALTGPWVLDQLVFRK